jgi:hypothetical protein
VGGEGDGDGEGGCTKPPEATPPPEMGIGELVWGGSDVVRIEGDWNLAEWCFEDGEEGGGKLGFRWEVGLPPMLCRRFRAPFEGEVDCRGTTRRPCRRAVEPEPEGGVYVPGG